jgi:hypothetical protein
MRQCDSLHFPHHTHGLQLIWTSLGKVRGILDRKCEGRGYLYRGISLLVLAALAKSAERLDSIGSNREAVQLDRILFIIAGYR